MTSMFYVLIYGAMNRLFWNWPREMGYLGGLRYLGPMSSMDISRHFWKSVGTQIYIATANQLYIVWQRIAMTFASPFPIIDLTYYLSKGLKWKEKLIPFNLYPILQPIFIGSGYGHIYIWRHI